MNLMKHWGLFSLVLLIATSCASCNNNSTYGELPQGDYNEGVGTDSGSLAGLFNMAEGFVTVVFPSYDKLSEFLVALLRDNNQVQYLQENWQELAKLEAGFIACIVFGLLFIVIVPIAGAIMCCCRTCCANCGGKLKQSTRRSKSCYRQCYCISLFVLTVLMAIPTVFVFLTNDWIGTIVNEAPSKTSNVLQNAISYIDNVHNQFDYVVDQYGVLDKSLRHSVEDLGNSVGVEAEKLANELAADSLNNLDTVIQDVDTIKASLTSIDQSVANITNGLNDLEAALDSQQTKMTTELAACATTTDVECKAAYESAQALGIEINSVTLQTLVDDLNDIVKKLNEYNLAELRDNVTVEIDSISDKVGSETASISGDAIAELDKANETFSTLKSNLPLNAVDSIKVSFSDVNRSIYTSVQSYDQNFDKYRYIAGAVLGSILAVIVVSYFLGMIMGLCGDGQIADSSDRNCSSNCGGIWLMVGVGLSFIFSWLLMILVLLTFTLGGHSTRYVCQPLSSPYDGLQILEDNIQGFNLSNTLNVSTSLKGLLLGCSNNTSLYNLLNLKKTFDLDQLVQDIESEFGKLDQTLNDTNVDLSSLEFYNDDVKNGLQSVNDSSIATFNFSAYEDELNKNVTDPDLNEYAKQLRILAANYDSPIHDNEKTLTLGYANDVEEIQSDKVDPLQLYIDDVKLNIDKIKAVQSDVYDNNKLLEESLKALDANIKANGTTMVKEAVQPVITDITDQVSEYLKWLVQQIKDNFGACRAVATVYDQTLAIICDYFIDTLNGLWFSIGWCVFLLIPSAIVAMKLMKFYRRMDFTEEYEDAFSMDDKF